MEKLPHTKEFSQALTRLTLRNDAVFFIAMLYTLNHVRCDPLVIRGQRTPAATDGVTLFYDGELFSKDSLDDRMYTFVHEIGHVMFFHSTRRGIRDPNLWNIACDYVVNGLIHETGMFKIPPTDIQPDPAFSGLSAEQVYDLLQKEASEALSNGKTEGQGKGGRKWKRAPAQPDGSGRETEMVGHSPNDVKDYNPADNEGKTAAEVEREIGIGTEKAMASAKAAGQGSQKIHEVLRQTQVRKEPWYGHLRRFMTAMHDRTYNWTHVNRRRAALFNVVAPDLRSESMGKLVVSIDESASLSSPQLAAISAHCADIFKEVRPKTVVVLRHTDDVTDEEVYDYTELDQFVLVRKSSGGTDFRPVFRHVEQEHGDAQVLLMFTDMEGPMPQRSSVETIWITSTPENRVATPFGERIFADFND